MKTLIFIVVALVAVMPLCAAPVDPDKPTVKADGSVSRTKEQDARLRDWIVGMMTENRLNKERATKAEDSETKVRVELGVATTKANNLQKEVNVVTDDRNLQAAAKDRALDAVDYWHQKHSEAVAKLWWWRLWAGGAIVVGVLLIVAGILMRFTSWGAKNITPLLSRAVIP